MDEFGEAIHLRIAEFLIRGPAEAARYAKSDLVRYGPGRVGFWSLVARHVGDPSVVLA